MVFCRKYQSRKPLFLTVYMDTNFESIDFSIEKKVDGAYMYIYTEYIYSYAQSNVEHIMITPQNHSLNTRTKITIHWILLDK